MNSTLSIFDANDLLSAEAAQRFAFGRDARELESFTHGIRQALFDDARSAKPRRPDIDRANYLASASFRGDSGCVHWDCRLPKIRAMARYAALYCDSAVVPVTIQPFPESPIHEHERIIRIAQRMADENAGRFSVTYNTPKGLFQRPYLDYKGPHEYLEHGQMGTVLDHAPRWASRIRRSGPVKLSTEAVRKHNLMLHIFYRMANDAFLQT